MLYRCELKFIALLACLLMASPMFVKAATDHYGVPIPEDMSVTQLSDLLDEADEEVGAFASTLKGVGYTEEALFNGTICGEKTYIVLGLNTTHDWASRLAARAGREYREMVVNFPDNLKDAFIDSPRDTALAIGGDTAANGRQALHYVKRQFAKAGTHLEIHRGFGLPAAAGRALLGLSKGVYVLVLELPLDVAVDVTKGLLRSSWSLVGDPVSGTLALSATIGVMGVGVAGSVALASIPASLTVVAATLEGLAVLATSPRRLVEVLF